MNGDLPPIIGESRAIREAVALARKIAPTTLPVLLVAPTGCGKELFAQWIHRWSGRHGEVLPINCAALPEHLLESELFGHDGQAYTGARRSKPGLMELAHQGTCLLDEVTSLAAPLQAKMLRVVEMGEVWRVGETKARRIDVRFVAAAQEDLEEQVTDRRFRRDLLQRLAGVVLRLPPLADRPEDILPLSRNIADLTGHTLEASAVPVLLRYSWPGNVRELRKAIERAACLAGNGTLTGAAIAQAIELGAPCSENGAGPTDIRQAGVLKGNAGEVIVAACEAHGWHAGRTARALGIGRTTLYERLRELGVSLREAKKRTVSGLFGTTPNNGEQSRTVSNNRRSLS